MHIDEEAFRLLYPKKTYDYEAVVSYSGRFSSYHANLQKRGRYLAFGLSNRWRGVDRDIQIGLLQSLLIKMFGKGEKTMHLGLYHCFLKNAHLAVPKTKDEPYLRSSFNRMNEQFFNGMLDPANLRWGKGLTQLGAYEFATDTISISDEFKDAPLELLDYVMYHEMLHKKHKFKMTEGKSFYHTPAFKRDEKNYPNHKEVEKRLKGYIRS
ncbi:MAG: M48 family metallopeptidase [Nanoarchaeota archaeon]